MNEAVQEPAAKPKLQRSGFTFTDTGCRTDLRAGALLLLAGIFLYQWWFELARWAMLVGLPLVLLGAVLQALQGRKGRPGYPWKLALAMTVLGAALFPDQLYRETAGGSLRLVAWPPLLLVAGLWMLAWWPVSRSKDNKANV